MPQPHLWRGRRLPATCFVVAALAAWRRGQFSSFAVAWRRSTPRTSEPQRRRPTRRGQHRLGRNGLQALPASAWIDVRAGPEVDPSGDGEVLPVLPLPTIEWPGNSVEIKAVEPAHTQLYEDMLSEGRRRVFCPFVRPTEKEDSPGMVPLHTIGAMLFLEDLQEVSAQTGGSVKYVAKHSVEGIARMGKVLNPSAFFITNKQGMKMNYTQAEVFMLDDNERLNSGKEAEVSADGVASASRLMDLWEDLRMLAERADEPRLQSHRYIRESVQRSPTWQLADLWQRLQLSTLAHRERARVTGEVREWIEVQQQQGRLPRRLPPEIDVKKLGLPTSLVEALMKSQNPSPIQGRAFWEPLLRMLSASGPERRRELLVDMAEREVQVTRTRAQLKEMLG